MSASENLHVSIVAPCYNEDAVIDAFIERVTRVMAPLDSIDYEFVFVDDGSVDNTSACLAHHADRDSRIKIVTLSRNFGHQNAIIAGLSYCTGDFIIVIDADLQDPPEKIPEMLKALQDGADIVHMVRSDRRCDSWTKRVSAQMFYTVMRRCGMRKLPENAGDFKAFNRRVLDALNQYGERVLFLRGIIAMLGFRQVQIPYVRDRRHAGISKYPPGRVIRLATDAFLSFNVFPLRFATLAGAATLFIALIYFLFRIQTLTSEITHLLMLLLLIFAGLILFGLGIIGEYLGRLYSEAKGRPLYIVESRLGFGGERPGDRRGDADA